MPRPHSISVRHSIITQRSRAHSMPDIALRLGISWSSVKTILSRYAVEGDAGLTTRYHNCGQSGLRTEAIVVCYFVCLRKWYPNWGYDKIRSLILAKYSSLKLPDRRTVYRWWHERGLVAVKSELPKEEKQWVPCLHNGWQIDAKEVMHLVNGQSCCWLNIVDEKSGMVIDPSVFPQSRINQVKEEDIRLVLHDIFTRRGTPKFIKVDNGRPFGDPTMKVIPILAMWLIGLGIKVVWNHPRTPQDNAKVERYQCTLGLWTEYQLCHNVPQLQEKLSEQARFYNYVFRDRRQENTTRKDRFPTLEKTPRPYNPEGFSMEQVIEFMATGKWTRTVSKQGQVNIQGQRFSVGRQYQKQQVTVRLEAVTKQWIITDDDKSIIARVDTGFNEEWLTCNLNV